MEVNPQKWPGQLCRRQSLRRFHVVSKESQP
jgi:hypothetical protein